MFRLMGETLPDSPQGADGPRAVGRVVDLAASRQAEGSGRPARWPRRRSLITDAIRAVADVSKAFANHGTGLVTGSVTRPTPFGAPEVRDAARQARTCVPMA